MKLINDHCKKTFDSAIVIGQVNKNGDIAGANKLLHETDVWLHMHVDGKDKSETKGMRLIATRKNRYGYGGQCHILSMWDDGMKEEGSLNEE
jgi:predicted ATP-dependent serine protease